MGERLSVSLVVFMFLLLPSAQSASAVANTTASTILRHTLLPSRAVSLFGSDMKGHCTTKNIRFCSGTSVLNDGNIPALNDLSLNSRWADQLLAIRRPVSTASRLSMSFELNDTNHNHVELYLFNCPKMTGINTPSVRVYFYESLTPARSITNHTDGDFNTYELLQNTSCDRLLPFCVQYEGVQSSRFITLEFPFEPETNSYFTFLGEVKFMNGGCSPHYHDLVTNPTVTPSPTESLLVTNRAETQSDSCAATALTTGLISVMITAILVAGISVIVHIAVYQCVYKPKLKSSATTSTYGAGWTDDIVRSGGDNAIVYDVVDEGAVFEMKENNAYCLTISR